MSMYWCYSWSVVYWES